MVDAPLLPTEDREPQQANFGTPERCLDRQIQRHPQSPGPDGNGRATPVLPDEHDVDAEIAELTRKKMKMERK